MRGSCEKAYLLTNKEDETRTVDVMCVLLTYGFDPINGSVVNKSLLKQKSVKTVICRLLHEVVKLSSAQLSSVPIDPNLPPPVIKQCPPKVKQPPPPPKRRIGQDDIEMKKGDWLWPKDVLFHPLPSSIAYFAFMLDFHRKFRGQTFPPPSMFQLVDSKSLSKEVSYDYSECDFMNFAKNVVCLQCDAKRPKQQLLPGEWECPQCNFLNYRRNMSCFHCEHKRPPDEYMEN
ncbi:hypothetical protein Ancab_024177 [Ancistrocladus abbreviatus]